MKKFALLAGFFILVAPFALLSQSEDPSDMFLKAYMTAQQGEKLEHDGQFAAAMAKYRFAGSLLEELRKRHGDWQPAIVEYRSRKVSENIMRVQGKGSTQDDLIAGATPLPEAAPPVLPQGSGAPDTNVEIAPPPARENVAPPPPPVEKPAQAPPAIVREPVKAPAPAATPNDAAIKEATKKLQKRVDELEADLKKSKDQFASAEKEKNAVNDRLKETSTKLEKAQGELDKSKVAEKTVRDNLAEAQDALKKSQAAGGGESKAQESLRGEIAQLKKALANVEAGRSAAEKGRAAAEKERDTASARVSETDQKIATATKDADQRVAAAAKERDDAISQLKNSKGAGQQVQALITENSNLKKKLADAEKSVRELSEDKPKKEKELADVKRQVDLLQQQLVSSQKQNKDYEVRVADLGKQLDDANKSLEEAKLVGATAEETARLSKENQILRNIVVRERQEEARRDQARKLMLAEFDKLKVKSDTLNEQIQLLAQPVTKLTDEELALLRQPIVSISDNNPTAIKASFTFAKKTDGSDASSTNQPAEGPAQRQSALPPESLGGFHPSVPENLVPMARDAKNNFDKGRYRTAEKLYQEILTKSPSNLYSLSNLGVVYFRTGKLKAAELTLKKAIAIAPKDEFARTTLGIVYYRQAKFDDALTELTKALAINPKSATAHNYLGITASQKGWQEAAEKEMLQAIADNPDYADAHFNLAVIYATATPPARELAKRHYARATSLGAQPDPSLEKLLQ